jgi:hypothetical protein
MLIVIALKMIAQLEAAKIGGQKPVSWRMRSTAFLELKRQSRYTGDVGQRDGRATFIGIPIEISDIRNSLGAELLT